MEKILVGYIEDLKKSGIDKYLLNVLQVAHENDIQLDFLSSNYSEEAAAYLAEYGCKVYRIHSLKKPWKHYKDVKQILRSGEYKKAYFNVSEPLNMMGARAAHKSGVYTVVHAHSSGVGIHSRIKRTVRVWINRFCRFFLHRYADQYLACSYTAGYWLFPKRCVRSKDFHIIYNAVDAAKFQASAEKRVSVRAQWGVAPDETVLGFVGSFSYPKNNVFLAEILNETLKLEPKARMVLVGDGADRPATEARLREFGIADKALFLGVRTDVAELMQGMDVFVLPSRFEGLPVVAVEAQLSGLPCVISTRIDDLVAISTNACLRENIDSAADWARAVMEVSACGTVEYDEEQLKNFSFEFNKKQLLEVILQ